MQSIQTTMIIDLGELSATLFSLTCNACHILRQYSHFDSLIWKDKENPVTQIDFLVQSYLFSKIRQKYGTFLPIVGQQDLTFTQRPQLESLVKNKLQALKLQNQIYLLHESITFNKKYDSHDLCVWIDPIDCTSGFTCNRLHEVTILIGVSYQGRPVLGLIGHPFSLKQHKTVFHPSVLIGSPELATKCAFQFTVTTKKWMIHQKQGHYQTKKAAIGRRQMSKQQCQMMKLLGLEGEMYGGAGYKCIKVIKRKVSTYLLMNGKTSKWDTCAGQAIILGMGGYVLKPTLQKINYLKDECSTNVQGFIITTNEQIYRKYVEALENKVKF